MFLQRPTRELGAMMFPRPFAGITVLSSSPWSLLESMHGHLANRCSRYLMGCYHCDRTDNPLKSAN
jgi:hypothetical protein